ncbi:MAG TPA: SDR family NAD(P)-dependent oxidoreductase [Solirubrobacteraceae bacterium]|nr:SDR family NAD(P)-dependent oxidoreductase [Solirubrobacteraceae bacterium]
MSTAANDRVWLITGASSGFGRALAEAALAVGDAVVGAARRVERLNELAGGHPGRFHPIALDVTDTERDRHVVEEVVDRFGRIDVLVNNAGRTQVGALEETTDGELRDLFDLHFFGPAALTRAALPHMRTQGSGWVVQMSSVGGQVTAPGFGAYCATKFALEGLTEAVSQEVEFARFLIVEPGAFRTDLFSRDAALFSEPMPEYERTVGPTRDYVRTGGGSQPGDPAKAVQAIITAITAERPPLRLVLGGDAIDGVAGRLRAIESELEEWQEVGRDTALDDGDAAPAAGS